MRLIQYTVTKTYWKNGKTPSMFSKKTKRLFSADTFQEALKIMPTQNELMLEMCVDEPYEKFGLETKCEYSVIKEMWDERLKEWLPLDKMWSLSLSVRGRDELKGEWNRKYADVR